MAQKLKIDIVAKDRSKQALQGLQGSLGRIKASVFNLRNAFIGLGAGLVIRNIVNTGKQIENLQVQLKFLFGSAQEGAKAFDEMAKFAAKVPFSLEEIQKGSGVLAVVSDDADELANLMKITGNVAAVTGLDFKTTAEQIQRSMSAGISAADLFRDKGVKDMLGFKAGATVSIEETAAAFERVFGEGGEFDGATDELAKTFSGTLSMIGDKVFNFKRVLLDAGFFSELKKQFGDLNKTLGDNEELLNKIARTIGSALAFAVEKVANGIKFMAEHSRELGIAFKVLVSLKIGFMLVRWGRALIPIVASMRALVSLSGVGLLAVAASVLAAKLTYDELGKAIDKIEEKINKNNKAFKDQRFHIPDMMDIAGAIKETEEPIKTMGEQFEELNETALQDFKDKIKDIKTTIVEGIHGGITKTSNALARAVIYGEKLSDTFKKMVQDIAYKLLAGMIEWVIRLSWAWVYTKYIKKEEEGITREKQKQLALQAAIVALGGGGGGGGNSLFSIFQHGGAIRKGQPAIVGERGPEMFIPNTTGQITQSARGTGGSPVNVNFSITALDASGFSDMLVQNRGTISNIINQAVNERGASNIV